MQFSRLSGGTACYVDHYLDDFVTFGIAGSDDCAQSLETIQRVCHALGVPLATEKMEGPAARLVFFSIEIDTVAEGP